MPVFDFAWWQLGTKLTAEVSVTERATGSLVQGQEVPLSLLSSSGSFLALGENMLTVLYYLEPIYALAEDAYYVVYGLGFAGSAKIFHTDRVLLLPYGGTYLLAPSFQLPVEGQRNALTLEGVLSQGHELGFMLGSPDTFLLLTNYGGRIDGRLYFNGRMVWTNAGTYLSQPFQTSSDYTAFRVSIFYWKSRIGVDRLHSDNPTREEPVFLLVGLTEAPVLIRLGSTDLNYSLFFGSLWIASLPLFGLEALRECWVRAFGHRMDRRAGTQFWVPVQNALGTWWPAHCYVEGASLVQAAGSLGLVWNYYEAPLVRHLVAGTVVHFGTAPFTARAPLQHFSLSQELSAEAITSSARLDLLPFRMTDWSTYRWVTRPLAFYRIRVPGLPGGELFLGARTQVSVQAQDITLRVSLELSDNQTLLKRMTVDAPVVYDYFPASVAAADFLARFGLHFQKHPDAADPILYPEFASERRANVTWTPRVGELALDFFNKIAQLAGWRVDWTRYGTVIALPRWSFVGSLWRAHWPQGEQALELADFLLSRLSVTMDDLQRRNILILHGVDYQSQADVISVFADLEAFLAPWSDRFLPLAVPAFVRFDRPVPSEWLYQLGQWMSERVFITPFTVEFILPFFPAIRPGDRLVFDNASPLALHRYEFVIESVRHEFGREYSTIVRAAAYKVRTN
jgi:hypothetical protein